MAGTEVLERLQQLGIKVDLHGDNIRMIPGSRVPTGLLEEVRLHKEEITQFLGRTYGDGQSPPPDRPPVTEQELRRLIDHLADPVAFSEWLEWAMNYPDEDATGLV